jgi:6-phosphogluconolactonase
MAPDSNITLVISPTPAEASSACAAFLARELALAVCRSGKAYFAISGGSSPRTLFAELAQAPLPWPNIHVFWVDERCVPADDPASNYRMAVETLLGPAMLSASNVHRVATELGPEAAAAAYAVEIEQHCAGVFDAVHRGLGPDAHTASLFPGEPLLTSHDGIARAVRVEKFNQWRVTLTPATLLRARATAIYAPGADKAEAIAHILTSPVDVLRYPAQVTTRQALAEHWFIDQPAAAKLPPALLRTANQ